MTTIALRAQKFYREFPEFKDSVFFYNDERFVSKMGYISVSLLSDKDKENIRNRASFSLQRSDERQKNETFYEIIANVSLDNESCFYSGLKSDFNFIVKNIDEVARNNFENDFSYYHETGHVLTNFNASSPDYLKVRNFMDSSEAEHLKQKKTLREECFADSYAALRMIQDHGAKAIGFIKFVADYRIINYLDSKHLTTFSIDRSIREAVELMKEGELKNKTPQELYDIAQKIADQDEFLLERRNDSLNLALIKHDPKTNQKDFDKESWTYGVYQDIKKSEKNSVDQQSFSEDLKSRFNMAVHRTFDLTNQTDRDATQEEEMFNGPWSDANAKYRHAQTDKRISDQNRDLKMEEDVAFKVRLYAKSEIRKLRFGDNDKVAENNLNRLAQDDEGFFIEVMNLMLLSEGLDKKRSMALDLLRRSEVYAKAYLNKTGYRPSYRLAKMNERKGSAVKPSTM